MPEPTPADTAPPAGEAATANGRAGAPRTIALSICLRIQESSGIPASVSWAVDSPAAALAIDIIAASGGAPDPVQGDPARGAILQALFFNLESALLAARRLQWALEGMAQSSQAAASATISLYSVEDPVAGSVAHTLERLSPGQVLLSAGIAEAVQQLPGFVLRPAFDANWREMQWQPQAAPASFEADEQSVLGLIHALGRQDPCAPGPGQARVETPAAAAPASATAVYEAPAGLGRSIAEPEAAMPLWKKPWVLVSAGAAVLVLLAAAIIPAMVSGSHPKAQVPDATTQTAPPAAPPGTPSPGAPSNVTTPAVPEKPRDQKPAAKPARQPKPEASPEALTQAPPPKPASASCDLTQGEIPLSLQRAERLMYAGKLDEAQDAYQHLLGCPSAREKAQEGLRQVKLRIATQSH